MRLSPLPSSTKIENSPSWTPSLHGPLRCIYEWSWQASSADLARIMLQPPSKTSFESGPKVASGMLLQSSEDCQTCKTMYWLSAHVKSKSEPALKPLILMALPAACPAKVLQAFGYMFSAGSMNVEGSQSALPYSSTRMPIEMAGCTVMARPIRTWLPVSG
jgi:hypothetical protein